MAFGLTDDLHEYLAEIKRLREEVERLKCNKHPDAAVSADEDAAWLRERIDLIGDCWEDKDGNCLRLSTLAKTLEDARDTLVAMAEEVERLKVMLAELRKDAGYMFRKIDRMHEWRHHTKEDEMREKYGREEEDE